MSAPVFSGGGRRNAAVGAREACMESAEKGAAGGGKRAHEAGEEVPRPERRAKARREVLSRRGRRDGMHGHGRKRADHGKKGSFGTGERIFSRGKCRGAAGRAASFGSGGFGQSPGNLPRGGLQGKSEKRALSSSPGICRERCREAGRDIGRAAGGAPGSGSGRGVGQGLRQRLRHGRRPLSASGTGEGRTGERLALRRQ